MLLWLFLLLLFLWSLLASSSFSPLLHFFSSFSPLYLFRPLPSPFFSLSPSLSPVVPSLTLTPILLLLLSFPPLGVHLLRICSWLVTGRKDLISHHISSPHPFIQSLFVESLQPWDPWGTSQTQFLPSYNLRSSGRRIASDMLPDAPAQAMLSSHPPPSTSSCSTSRTTLSKPHRFSHRLCNCSDHLSS